MRHIFLINPAAGGGKNHDALTAKIEAVCQARGIDYMIHVTRFAGDATETVHALCREASAQNPIRFMHAVATVRFARYWSAWSIALMPSLA